MRAGNRYDFVVSDCEVNGGGMLKFLRKYPGAIARAELIPHRGRLALWWNPLAPAEPVPMG
jgi:hypothetical protein